LVDDWIQAVKWRIRHCVKMVTLFTNLAKPVSGVVNNSSSVFGLPSSVFCLLSYQ